MNTPNFTLMQLNAQERRQALLRQAQQAQLLATLKPHAGPRFSFRGVSLWMRNVRRALIGAMPKRVEKPTLVRSSTVS